MRVAECAARELKAAPPGVEQAKVYGALVLAHNKRWATDPEYAQRVRARALETE